LKLKCDALLLIFCFQFNLRRYTEELRLPADILWGGAAANADAAGGVKVSQCRLNQ